MSNSQGLLLQLESLADSILKRFGEAAEEAFLSTVEDYLGTIGDDDLFYEKSAYELLWGYDDPVLEMLTDFKLADSGIFSLEVRAFFLHSLCQRGNFVF